MKTVIGILLSGMLLYGHSSAVCAADWVVAQQTPHERVEINPTTMSDVRLPNNLMAKKVSLKATMLSEHAYMMTGVSWADATLLIACDKQQYQVVDLLVYNHRAQRGEANPRRLSPAPVWNDIRSQSPEDKAAKLVCR